MGYLLVGYFETFFVLEIIRENFQIHVYLDTNKNNTDNANVFPKPVFVDNNW